MTLFCGIDLHSNNSLISVIDDENRVVGKRRLPNDLPIIVSYLMPYISDLVGCVVESTYNWYWLVDGLMDHGFSIHLANPNSTIRLRLMNF